MSNPTPVENRIYIFSTYNGESQKVAVIDYDKISTYDLGKLIWVNHKDYYVEAIDKKIQNTEMFDEKFKRYSTTHHRYTYFIPIDQALNVFTDCCHREKEAKKELQKFIESKTLDLIKEKIADAKKKIDGQSELIKQRTQYELNIQQIEKELKEIANLKKDY
jgi:hypothetical protein